MENNKKQSIYILTSEDVDRIDHLIGVVATAVSELLVAKRVRIPSAPEWLPAEEQCKSSTCPVIERLSCSDVETPGGVDHGQHDIKKEAQYISLK